MRTLWTTLLLFACTASFAVDPLFDDDEDREDNASCLATLSILEGHTATGLISGTRVEVQAGLLGGILAEPEGDFDEIVPFQLKAEVHGSIEGGSAGWVTVGTLNEQDFDQDEPSLTEGSISFRITSLPFDHNATVLLRVTAKCWAYDHDTDDEELLVAVANLEVTTHNASVAWRTLFWPSLDGETSCDELFNNGLTLLATGYGSTVLSPSEELTGVTGTDQSCGE
ncbi:MAG: hypothetical protein KF812_06835 [Fimbriimonadaceae bacterium]|nr:hypothetical protein [Fimbriimonadaceae bacterium]